MATKKRIFGTLLGIAAGFYVALCIYVFSILFCMWWVQLHEPIDLDASRLALRPLRVVFGWACLSVIILGGYVGYRRTGQLQDSIDRQPPTIKKHIARSLIGAVIGTALGFGVDILLLCLFGAWELFRESFDDPLDNTVHVSVLLIGFLAHVSSAILGGYIGYRSSVRHQERLAAAKQ